MSIQDEVALLREVPPFSNLDSKKLQLLAFMSERLNYPAGETVLKQGDTGDAVFVLIDGLIDVFITTDGVSSPVRELGRHTIFGEIAVILDTVRNATVTAKTDITVLKISKDVLQKMIEDLPDLGMRLAAHIEKAGYTFQ